MQTGLNSNSVPLDLMNKRYQSDVRVTQNQQKISDWYQCDPVSTKDIRLMSVRPSINKRYQTDVSVT